MTNLYELVIFLTRREQVEFRKNNKNITCSIFVAFSNFSALNKLKIIAKIDV